MDIVKEKVNNVTSYTGNSPLFIYTIFYLSGILIGYSQNTPIAYIYTGAVLSVLTAFIIYLRRRVETVGDLIIKFLLISSFILTGYSNIIQSPYALKNVQNTKVSTEDKKHYAFIVKNHIKISRNFSYTHCILPQINEGVILFNSEENNLGLLPGDIIYAHLQLKEIAPSNKDSFDFKDYYRKRRIFTQGFLTKENHSTERPAKKTFTIRLKCIREKILNRFAERGDGEWRGLFLGIIIGDKRFINNDTKSAFASTGTLHIMSVSGMHVSFFYLFLSFLLSFLGRSRSSEVVKAVLISSILWFYCAVVGFSPSCTRAVLMVTLLMISRIISRKSFTLNTLCASALIITIFSPESLFDIGFQLSYAALLSIIFINPKLSQLLPSKNRYIKWMWGILSLSISCSIGTSLITLSLYGFFPFYFMISNIILIPLTASVIYLSATALIMQITIGEGDIIMTLISRILSAMIRVADKIDSLPFSKIYLNIGHEYRTVIIALILTCFTGNHLRQETKKYIYAGLVINLIIIYFITR